MFNKSILIIDPVTPKPYTLNSLKSGRMGGTEATVIRVVTSLIARGYDIVMELRGQEGEDHDNEYPIVYCPLNLLSVEKVEWAPDVVITLRDARVFKDAHSRFPNSKHYLWMHDVVSGEYANHLETELGDGVYNLISVSQWHRNQILNALPNLSIQGRLKITPIYNPVADYCHKYPDSQVNPYKLIYFSSPHKGLDQALAAFQLLRKIDSRYELIVANPGYYPDQSDLPEGVNHIQMDHKDLMKEVSTSLCMFYPQTSFAETFGIVYAESNALGTPVLAHNIGAAQEVLDNPKQLVNCTNIGVILDTVQRWSKGERPTVGLCPQFAISEVIKSWIKLIEFGSVG